MWYAQACMTLHPPTESPELIQVFLQGTGDNFYKQGQLLPENFVNAAKEAGVDAGLMIRYQPDYDHSYYTIATFSEDHIEHAAKYLFA